MESPRTNINSIAKEAGVSTTTVSNFINCSESIPISAAKQELIMAAMRKAKYRPSAASSQLRRNSALPEKAVFIYGDNPEADPFKTCRNPMLSELLFQLAAKLSKRNGMRLEIRAVADERSLEAWNEAIADAGAALCYGRLDSALVKLSTRRNVPLIALSDCKEPKFRQPDSPEAQERIDCVSWDAASHMETVFRHLLEGGARRIAFVSSWNIRRNHPQGFSESAEAKMARFLELLGTEPGLSGEIVSPERPQDVSPLYEERNAYEFIKGKDRLFDSFDAIIGHNDFVARGVTAALLERGLKPGKDVKVCGEGDFLECRGAVPAISTVSYDKEALAGNACETLARRLEWNVAEGARITIPSRLVRRETS